MTTTAVSGRPDFGHDPDNHVLAEAEDRRRLTHADRRRPHVSSHTSCWLVTVLAVLGACFEKDSYVCTSDAQCDVGEGGRCEIDGRCTAFDPSCPAGRRYAAHAEDRTGTCFDDRIELANTCAGGQPPARPEGCAATVCAEVPGCCASGWSDACAQLAQIRCEPTCTTELAIVAARGAREELWQLTWQGSGWAARRRTEYSGVFAWVGPKPGESAPREAGLRDGGSTLVVGDAAMVVDPAHVYAAITTVDVDRDGRDTVVATYQTGAPATTHVAQIVKLASATVREVEVTASLQLAWGDTNRDGFPDGIAGVGQKYSLLENIDGDGDAHVRTLSSATSGNFAGMATTGSPGLRAFEWIDMDRDGALDLVAFGSSIRVHAGSAGISDTPLANYDCDPPGATCDTSLFSFAGAALPTATGPAIAVATFEAPPATTRKVYRIAIDPAAPATPHVEPLELDACPGCPALIALVARDVDGDHALDLVGIDADLRVYTGLAKDGLRMHVSTPVAPTGGNFNTIRVTATGAPR